MNARLHAGRLIAAASGFVVTAVLAATPDPWPKAVAPPTGCYSGQDQFAAKNEVAIESLLAETEKQDEINQKIADQLTEQNNEDPMKMAAAMQEALMKDPQNAMKYMEQMGATDPGATQAQSAQYIERMKQVKDEETALLKSYNAAFDKAWAPVRARFAAYNAKIAQLPVGKQGPDWVMKENHALQLEANRSYEAMCGQWFGATGSMQAYLKKYKDYLVEERIPADEKGDAQRLTQYQMIGIPADSYRSTAKQKAVTDYMQLAERLYRPRREQPQCPGGRCEFVGGF